MLRGLHDAPGKLGKQPGAADIHDERGLVRTEIFPQKSGKFGGTLRLSGRNPTQQSIARNDGKFLVEYGAGQRAFPRAGGPHEHNGQRFSARNMHNVAGKRIARLLDAFADKLICVGGKHGMQFRPGGEVAGILMPLNLDKAVFLSGGNPQLQHQHAVRSKMFHKLRHHLFLILGIMQGRQKEYDVICAGAQILPVPISKFAGRKPLFGLPQKIGISVYSFNISRLFIGSPAAEKARVAPYVQHSFSFQIRKKKRTELSHTVGISGLPRKRLIRHITMTPSC